MTEKVPPSELSDNSLDKVRELLIGRDDKFVQEKLNRDAKGIVTNVVSEALFDRETKDGSVNKVLVPLVEKSLHRSIEANSDKIVGTLYPLVGTLVRKAVSSFLVEFVERTNALIENSLSPKSVSWRFKAWQSGIRYSEYVASQIYQYQVQQLLVIHRETGTLLHSISSDPDKEKDADLISSMLVAINDFVADAFGVTSTESENELGEIKTEDFTLLIKIGPQALLVAAVTGSIPPEVRGKLQQALEDFHQFYQQPLLNYEGDNAPFDGCETILSDCLISERKEGEGKKSKRLIGAVVLLAIFLGLAVLSFMRLSLSILKSDLHELTPPPGIIVTDTYISNGNVHAKVLRDPIATSIESWFSENGIDTERVTVIEEPFVSLKPSVVERKLSMLVSDYPLSESENISMEKGENGSFVIAGTVFTPTAINFTQQIGAIPGISMLSVDTTSLNVKAAHQVDNAVLQKAALNRLVNKVSSQNVLFATNQEALSEVQLAKLEPLANDIKQLLALADKTETVVSIIVMGASDNSGSSARNRALSQKRAENVVNSLISLGVESDILIPVSLGELPLQKASMGRSVMLNVLISSEQQ
ncbi:OmpA/MotB protein [Alteromonas macleodii str. 'Black Sea 11']|nr:OmpA/MotB protein [Alteromonas macleodii str. 'Black Sea 11']NKW89713.1 OmpA family protein [Alteromonadaceae bacterium A_SAG4]NKX18654.1 OmpA family protein [Alteromonadaceae bacterium A_SAG5]NKX33422.1 OmpA family protein [Alteromonadaceae bacterium A_SAG3]